VSFQIEYTGSLVDNRDVAQVTTSSSLVQNNLSQVSPALWQFNAQPIGPLPYINSQAGQNTTAIYTNVNGAGLIEVENIAGVNCMTAPMGAFINSGVYFELGSLLNQTITVQFRTANSASFNTDAFYFLQIWGPTGANIATPRSNVPVFPATTYTTVYNVPSNAGYFELGVLSFTSSRVGLEFITVTAGSTSAISVTPSTLTSGAAKTGGTAITPTITTVQDGAVAITGPANNFGLVAKDGTPIKNSALFYPSALDSEESEATISNVKVIQADTTAISVEGTGLGGTEKLKSGSSIIVEDVDHIGSN
jgi:hypothetical protein